MCPQSMIKFNWFYVFLLKEPSFYVAVVLFSLDKGN